MANFLVLSHKHTLFPLAWSLRGAGHNVQVLVRKDRYEKAWEGLFEKHLVGRDKGPANMQALVELAEGGELFVVTDSPAWEEKFKEAPRLFGNGGSGDDPLGVAQIGAWWDGEGYKVPHLIVRDVGAWAGNQGPLVSSSAGCAWFNGNAMPESFVSVMDGLKDHLKSLEFKGLVRVGVKINHDGTVSHVNHSTGWDVLHLHLLLSGVENVGELFVGEVKVTHRYSFALPVSIPPWPYLVNMAAKEVEVKGLSVEMRKSVGWHDVRKVGKTIMTAGLDGLVGVVRRSSDHPTRCIGECLEVAGSMDVEEKQFRSDGGGLFARVVMELDRVRV